MYSMDDYRAVLDERDKCNYPSEDWKNAQKKVTSIVAAMVSAGDRRMIDEVVEEVYSLNDCGVIFDDEAVQYGIWLLESNGYTVEAQELRELDWA